MQELRDSPSTDFLQAGPVICGDCLQVLPQLPARTFHLVFLDPPSYIGVDYSGAADADRLRDADYPRFTGDPPPPNRATHHSRSLAVKRCRL